MNEKLRRGAVAAILALAIPAAGFGAGFGLFEMGSKSTGMGGAFTATADDASAMFYNPAGLAYLAQDEFYGGGTLITPTSEFDGSSPFPGPGAKGEMEHNYFTPVGLFYSHPFGDKVVAGIGVFTPFGLGTEWQHKDTWSGRFISQKAVLETYSIQPTIAFKLMDNLSLGLGAEYRIATVELQRNVPSVNPYTQTVVDVAHVKLESTGTNADWGFSAGLLYKPMENLRLGLSYRHHIDIDMDGEAGFTQISTGYADLDAAVAAQLPFGAKEKVQTGIAFPSLASFGIAYDLRKDMTIEADANWTGWNRFESLPINFVDRPDLSSTVDESYSNVWNFRLGFEKRYDGGLAARLGYVYDNTPQPNKTVNPLLPDADRAGYSIGCGWTTGGLTLDVAYMYLTFREAQTKGVSGVGFEGKYDNFAHLLGIHLRYRF